MELSPPRAVEALWRLRMTDPSVVCGEAPPAHSIPGVQSGEDFSLDYGDAIHQSAVQGPMFDESRAPEKTLVTLPVKKMLDRRAIACVRSYEYYQRFLVEDETRSSPIRPVFNLDLRGMTLMIPFGGHCHERKSASAHPARVELASSSPLRNPMRPGGKQWVSGGGALACGSFDLDNTIMVASDAQSPITITSYKTVLTAPSILSGGLVTDTLVIANDKGPARINGHLSVESTASLCQTHPLTVTYCPVYDPTADDSSKHYRGFLGDTTTFHAIARRGLEREFK